MQFLQTAYAALAIKQHYDYICVHVYISCRIMRKSLKNSIMATFVRIFMFFPHYAEIHKTVWCLIHSQHNERQHNSANDLCGSYTALCGSYKTA